MARIQEIGMYSPPRSARRVSCTGSDLEGIRRLQPEAKTGLTRRSFVAGSATAALSGLVVPWKAADPANAASEAGNWGNRVNPWKVLARSISGPVLRPGDPGFEELALPYNLREASVMPAGIARCLDASDVATSIKWRGGIIFRSSPGREAIPRPITRSRPA